MIKFGKVGCGFGLIFVYDFVKSCGGLVKLGNVVMGGVEVCMCIFYVVVILMCDGLVLLVDDDDDVCSMVWIYLC